MLLLLVAADCERGESALADKSTDWVTTGGELLSF